MAKLNKQQLYKRAYNWQKLKNKIEAKEKAMKLQVEETDRLRAINRELQQKLAEAKSQNENKSDVNGILLKSKAELKKICCDYFRWWWNQPGTNTEQGFEKWWEERNKQNIKLNTEDSEKITKDEIKHLIENHGLNIMDVIDVVIKINGIIGVGLITLGKTLNDYCHDKIKSK
jgi:YesN/AraC family two-component response regulator